MPSAPKPPLGELPTHEMEVPMWEWDPGPGRAPPAKGLLCFCETQAPHMASLTGEQLQVLGKGTGSDRRRQECSLQRRGEMME